MSPQYSYNLLLSTIVFVATCTLRGLSVKLEANVGHRFPYAVEVLEPGTDKTVCDGVLITENTVLSAASCIESVSRGGTRVSVRTMSGEVFASSNVVINPSQFPDPSLDVALVHLSSETGARPIQILDDLPQAGLRTDMPVWGLNTDDTAKIIPLRLLPEDECKMGLQNLNPYATPKPDSATLCLVSNDKTACGNLGQPAPVVVVGGSADDDVLIGFAGADMGVSSCFLFGAAFVANGTQKTDTVLSGSGLRLFESPGKGDTFAGIAHRSCNRSLLMQGEECCGRLCPTRDASGMYGHPCSNSSCTTGDGLEGQRALATANGQHFADTRSCWVPPEPLATGTESDCWRRCEALPLCAAAAFNAKDKRTCRLIGECELLRRALAGPGGTTQGARLRGEAQSGGSFRYIARRTCAGEPYLRVRGNPSRLSSAGAMQQQSAACEALCAAESACAAYVFQEDEVFACDLFRSCRFVEGGAVGSVLGVSL